MSQGLLSSLPSAATAADAARVAGDAARLLLPEEVVAVVVRRGEQDQSLTAGLQVQPLLVVVVGGRVATVDQPRSNRDPFRHAVAWFS